MVLPPEAPVTDACSTRPHPVISGAAMVTSAVTSRESRQRSQAPSGELTGGRNIRTVRRERPTD